MVLVKTQAHRSINRIESPEIKKSGVYGVGKTGEPQAEKNASGPLPYATHKNQSK